MLRTTVAMMGFALALCACGDDVDVVEDDAGSDVVDSGTTDAGTTTRRDGGRDAGVVGDPYEAAQMAQRTITTELCECDFAVQGFDDAADCVTANGGSTQAQACDLVGYEAADDELAEFFSCVTHNNRALATCYVAAECDPSAIDECTGVTCADPPEAAGQAYAAARAACIATMVTGPAGTCPEGDVVMTTGESVFSGTTIGAGDDSNGGDAMCDGEGAPDRAFRWAAPMAGTYVFDTIGSTFDTILYLRAACADTTTLACGDDIELEVNNLRSSVTLTLTAGQEVIVIVDGYGDAGAGDFVVNIEPMGATDTDGGVADGGMADAGAEDAGVDAAVPPAK